MRFVLVHGGFHAGWCWERTVAELNRLGHEAEAVDLPGHGTRVDDPLTEWTIPCRRDAILAAIRPGDVLVGHSGGGFDATVAADAAVEAVSHIVYLAAALPREGRSYPEAMAMRNTEDGEFDGDVGEMLGYLHFDDEGAMTFADFGGAWRYFYHDCDETTARWAFDRLGPEKFGAVNDTRVSLPRFWAAELPRSFIRCTEDRSMPRWLADSVSERLGVEQLTIEASHSPFLSRPAELAELLVHATTTRPIGPLQPD
ncbi:esterase [Mycolicibacterium aromaticivorans JS19b1 = JCM 16368]|uniref:Esterase n=1 Tax=Mycolicibacterium aromaticivorans JS19b1 = JCM 16368 TaxID=1440774 RepID=A0A064CNY1_9MYCO|nr:alpha/beta fold hydrolase [Mycolicibacterium aromaticivorans]KDF02071.1 esterase [Mycolicibacterium aromaticivorans JS19b1 = JCM 16368]